MGEAFGWTNLALPLVVIAAAAIIVPQLTVPGNTRSQGRLALGIGIAALVMFVLGIALFAVIHLVADTGFFGAAGSVAATMGELFRQSIFAAMVWLPILCLVWFGMAQGVEKRRGEDAMNRGKG